MKIKRRICIYYCMLGLYEACLSVFNGVSSDLTKVIVDVVILASVSTELKICQKKKNKNNNSKSNDNNKKTTHALKKPR